MRSCRTGFGRASLRLRRALLGRHPSRIGCGRHGFCAYYPRFRALGAALRFSRRSFRALGAALRFSRRSFRALGAGLGLLSPEVRIIHIASRGLNTADNLIAGARALLGASLPLTSFLLKLCCALSEFPHKHLRLRYHPPCIRLLIHDLTQSHRIQGRLRLGGHERFTASHPYTRFGLWKGSLLRNERQKRSKYWASRDATACLSGES
jgi:hypothetical protein